MDQLQRPRKQTCVKLYAYGFHTQQRRGAHQRKQDEGGDRQRKAVVQRVTPRAMQRGTTTAALRGYAWCERRYVLQQPATLAFTQVWLGKLGFRRNSEHRRHRAVRPVASIIVSPSASWPTALL